MNACQIATSFVSAPMPRRAYNTSLMEQQADAKTATSNPSSLIVIFLCRCSAGANGFKSTKDWTGLKGRAMSGTNKIHHVEVRRILTAPHLGRRIAQAQLCGWCALLPLARVLSLAARTSPPTRVG